jgi:hypothetical protein
LVTVSSSARPVFPPAMTAQFVSREHHKQPARIRHPL